jgi:hypothetical protein
MNCRRAKKLVFDFIDGIADEPVRLELEQHLSQCEECEKLASGLTRSMDLLHRAPVETLDENFNWKVRLGVHKERRAIEESLASQGAMFKAWNIRYIASAAAGLVMMIAAGWMAVGTGLVAWNGGAAVTNPAPLAYNDAGASSSATPSTQLQGSPFTSRSAAQPVSEGLHGPVRRENARQGAITSSNGGVNLDSLIQVEMSRRSDAERVQYLQQQIQLLNRHLDRYTQQKPE